MRLVDTHCHLQLAAFAPDADAVLERARGADVGLVIVGTNRATSEAAVRFAEASGDEVWATVGIHPNHTHKPYHDPNELATPPEEEMFDEAFFKKTAASKKIVAIGETGLDYYRIEAGGGRTIEEIKARQLENFRGHIHFARERNLPLIIHVRDAHEAVLTLLHGETHENGALRGVIHCFSGTVGDALRYVELGFYISFTGTITYPPRKDEGASNPLIEVAKAVPLERILVETDSPYLSPIPLRGKRNEPANVQLVAEAIADARGLSADAVADATTENAIRLFGLGTI